MSCYERCWPRTVALIGTVTGVGGPVSGATVTYTVCCQTHSVTTDANGQYVIQVWVGANVTVEVQAMIGVTVSPSSYTFQACNDRTDLNFTLTPVVPTPTVFTISGAVSGLASVAGVAVNFAIDGVPASTTTDAGGNYSIVAPSGSAVVITPSAQPGYTVLPASINIPSLSANMTGQNFVYTAI